MQSLEGKSATAASLSTPQRSMNEHSLEEGYVHYDVFYRGVLGLED